MNFNFVLISYVEDLKKSTTFVSALVCTLYVFALQICGRSYFKKGHPTYSWLGIVKILKIMVDTYYNLNISSTEYRYCTFRLEASKIIL
jgi:hypothetical protein